MFKKVAFASTFAVVLLFSAPVSSIAQLQGDIDTETTSSCVDLQINLRYRSTDAKTGGAVSELQDFLQSAGLLNSEPTGFFGLQTLGAVKSYQKGLGLSPTGFVGPLTRGKIKLATCGGEQRDAVSLSSVTLAGDSVVVEYSKNFQTCAHLVDGDTLQLLHKQNFICDIGNNLIATDNLKDFHSGLREGQGVRLCHGNNSNTCSGLVNVRSKTPASTIPSLGQPQLMIPPQTTPPAKPLTPATVVPALITPVPLPAPVPESSGFTWGVNAHPLYESHRNISAIEHLDAVKGLGMTSLRVDVYDATPTTLARLDTYVAEGKKRGVSILPVISLQIIGYSSDSIKSRAYSFGHTLASRYKNDIHVWELSNELDNYSMIKPCESRDNGTVYSCSFGDPDGESPLDYRKTRYEEARALLLGLGEGVRAADPSARRIIDFSAWHIGFIERLVADGVPFDIVGWHWYNGEYSLENVNGVNLIQKIAAHGKPIWMTEFNKWQGSRASEAAQAAELQKLMDHFTKLASAYKITGAHIYELYDNPSEMDFGLIKLTSAGGAGAKKAAYEAVKNKISGVVVTIPSTPKITSVSPEAGSLTPGQTVTLGGTQLNLSANKIVANGNTYDASFVRIGSGAVSATELSFTLRSVGLTASGTYPVKIANALTGDSNTVYLTIVAEATGAALSLPTATFTVNGGSATTLNPNDAFVYQWSSQNADRFSSKYYATCENGAVINAAWIATEASGSSNGNATDAAAFGCTYTITYTATQSFSGKSDSKSVTVKINSSVSSIGTAPTLPAPTASLTINGADSATLSLGDAFTYQWTAGNADRFSSNYSVTCTDGRVWSDTWAADSAQGSVPGTVTADAAGCTYTVNYKAIQSSTGKEASKTITVKINSTYSSIGTAPTVPTASLTINGKASDTTPIGTQFRYEWSSSNADKYESNYSASCTGGGTWSDAWAAETASGSVSGTITPEAAGCTYVVTYKATSNATGKSAAATVTVIVPLTTARNSSSARMAAGAATPFFSTPGKTSALSEAASFSYTFTQDLYRGQQGAEVSALQKALKQLGFYSGDVTGTFYDQTREAVMRFQAAYDIRATGYVGPATRAMLNQLLAS